MVVISNSSPLIALGQIGRLDMLGQIHPQVRIPPAVAVEVQPTIARLPGWIEVYLVFTRTNRTAHHAWPTRQLILDERPARRLAVSLGLTVIGTIGLLLAAKDRGLLVKIKPELDRLLSARFFMDQELYDRAVRQAGE